MSSNQSNLTTDLLSKLNNISQLHEYEQQRLDRERARMAAVREALERGELPNVLTIGEIIELDKQAAMLKF